MELNELKEAMAESMFTNAKLAKAVEVMMSYHMTTKEKESVSISIHSCKNTEELGMTMEHVYKELHNGFADASNGEKWSPLYVKEISRYYEDKFPFNPLLKMGELLSTIKQFIMWQEIQLKMDPEKRKELDQNDLDEKKVACHAAIREVEELVEGLGG